MKNTVEPWEATENLWIVRYAYRRRYMTLDFSVGQTRMGKARPGPPIDTWYTHYVHFKCKI